jgi:hypothetical protein
MFFLPLPPGEGCGEGNLLALAYPLTQALSQREREQEGIGAEPPYPDAYARWAESSVH